MLDFVRFDNVIAPFLRSYRPNVVVLQVGGNDVDTCGQTVQTISIAGALDELAMRLLNTFGVSGVYIGEIFFLVRGLQIFGKSDSLESVFMVVSDDTHIIKTVMESF